MWIGKSAIAIFLVAQLYRRLKTAKLVCTVLLSQIMTNKRGQEMSGTVLIGFWILIITPCTPLRIYFDLVWFCFMQGLREICCFFACFHRVALVMFLWVVSLLSKIAAMHFRPAFMAADCTCRQSRYGTIILQAAEVDYFPNRLYDMTCLQ